MIWLFFGSAVSIFGATCCAKMNSKTVASKKGVAYALVLLLNGLTACVFFAVSSLFCLGMSGKTLLYAGVYACVVTLSLVSSLKIYGLTAVSNVSLITSATGLTVTSALGWVLFQEEITFLNVLRIVLMLAAVVCVFLNVREKERTGEERKIEKPKRGIGKLSIWLAGMAVASVSSTILMKFYARADGVADNNSLFFFTNVFLVLGSGVAFFIAKTREKAQFRAILQKFTWKEFVFMIGNTLCSNVSSLVNAALIAIMAVSVYTPVNSALSLLCGVAVSLAFREKQGKFTWIAVTIALIAIFIIFI